MSASPDRTASRHVKHQQMGSLQTGGLAHRLAASPDVQCAKALAMSPLPGSWDSRAALDWDYRFRQPPATDRRSTLSQCDTREASDQSLPLIAVGLARDRSDTRPSARYLAHRLLPRPVPFRRIVGSNWRQCAAQAAPRSEPAAVLASSRRQTCLMLPDAESGWFRVVCAGRLLQRPKRVPTRLQPEELQTGRNRASPRWTTRPIFRGPCSRTSASVCCCQLPLRHPWGRVVQSVR